MVAYYQHLLERLQFIPRMKKLARIPMAAKYILRFVYGCYTRRIGVNNMMRMLLYHVAGDGSGDKEMENTCDTALLRIFLVM
jgi:hypothetical protein